MIAEHIGDVWLFVALIAATALGFGAGYLAGVNAKLERRQTEWIDL